MCGGYSIPASRVKQIALPEPISRLSPSGHFMCYRQWLRFFLTLGQTCATPPSSSAGFLPGVRSDWTRKDRGCLMNSLGFICGILVCDAKKMMQAMGLAMLLFLICPPIFSQTNQGTIQGTVIDQSGGAVAGATVTVSDPSRGAARTLVTDSAENTWRAT